MVAGVLCMAVAFRHLIALALTCRAARVTKDIKLAYGDGSYCLVTGCTEGIGRAFAKEVASRGMNLVLVARNKDKLEAVKKQIEEECPKVKIVVVVADFTECNKAEFMPNLLKEVKDLDISLLVNNVGISHFDKFDECSLQQVTNLVIVNTLSQTVMLHEFLPRLNKRGSRSAVINLSSCLAVSPSNWLPLYTATKAFSSYLTQGLELTDQYKNIDFQDLCPHRTSSNLNDYDPPSMATASSEDCVAASLNTLGHAITTPGSLKHVLIDTVHRLGFYLLGTRLGETVRLYSHNLLAAIKMTK